MSSVQSRCRISQTSNSQNINLQVPQINHNLLVSRIHSSKTHTTIEHCLHVQCTLYC